MQAEPRVHVNRRSDSLKQGFNDYAGNPEHASLESELVQLRKLAEAVASHAAAILDRIALERRAPTSCEAVAPDVNLLDEEAAAKRLKLSAQTLRNLRCKGGGPTFVKAGRAVRYLPADLDEWVLNSRRKSTSDKGKAVSSK